MPGTLDGKRIAFLVAQEGVEEVELTEPWKAVREAGAEPVLIAPEEGEVQALQPPRQERYLPRRRDARGRRPGAVRRRGAARRRRQPRSAAHRRATRSSSCMRYSRRASRWASSATDRGRSSRPTWSRAAGSLPGRRCRRTSATRVASGSTRRWSSIRASSRAASPMTCRRSARRSSRSSPRASTRSPQRARRWGGERLDGGLALDPGEREDPVEAGDLEQALHRARARGGAGSSGSVARRGR